jgi:pyruvate-ferredoxin/flavodoxin oxidoreductase
MDDLERTSESPALSTAKPHIARMQMLDAEGAVRLAESIAKTKVEVGDDERAVLAACHDAAERGERSCAIVRITALAASREPMRRVAQNRLGIVVHALSGHGGEDLSALVDLGWGVLCASNPEDSFDLTLVARRAAEDCGVPFVVVHALGDREAAGRAFAMVAVPHEKSCEAFLGASRLVPRHDPAHPSLAPLGDRAFGERAPFALAAALREYANVSGRRHDVVDKAPLGESPLVLVGMGPVGDALLSAIPELRARGYDVGAVHVTALRPFPGARLVKALSRALAVTVLEPADEPLAQGGILAREIKSAFTDAITWAPGFPGIGRIPKLFHGVTGASFDVAALAAICENMLADERGKRSFSFADADHALPRPSLPEAQSTGPVAIRWALDVDGSGARSAERPEEVLGGIGGRSSPIVIESGAAERALAVAVESLATALGLRAHAIVAPRTTADAKRTVVDIVATREHARGGMARRGPRLVIATEGALHVPEVASSLSPGSVLAVLVAEGGAITDFARAVARERRVRIVPIVASAAGVEPSVALGAACAGAALAAAARAHRISLDPAHAARAVADHYREHAAAHADVAGDRARQAYEAAHHALVAPS